MRYSLGRRPGGAGAVAGAVLLRAGLAGRALGARGGPAALGADAGGLALGVLPAAALALVLLRAFGVAPRLALGPEPGGAGAIGHPALLRTGLAERALRRGRNLAALQAEPGRTAGLGPAVKACKIVSAPGLDIAVSHDGLLPANPGMDGKTPRRHWAGGASGKGAVSPSGGGRRTTRSKSPPSTGPRRGS